LILALRLMFDVFIITSIVLMINPVGRHSL